MLKNVKSQAFFRLNTFYSTCLVFSGVLLLLKRQIARLIILTRLELSQEKNELALILEGVI